ncbi:ABC transporter permease subunit [Stenotrophomonas maltophilia]|uniref:ABC transporter permease subunit n=1 Tax=Stenotrophomonas maltophilia TaxID=40324 RepID=UPI002893E80F|nr:ABC transporter permease subunit [Stenotrophomonas maltophilia]MDT3499500.1 ABC transporter permease subunit [Stenotrophomonas maltophilia]
MSSLSVAGHEVRRLLRDRALPTLLVLLLALAAYAAWNGRAWVEQRDAAIGVIQLEEQHTHDRSRVFVGKAPSVLPRVQPVLRPAPMASVSIGQAEAYPYTADVVALGDRTQLFRNVWADIGNPAARAAGRFDLAFVIVFLLPLVILAASYDLWSRERERGIAALVLSQPVAVGRLIAVKALARGGVVLLPAGVILVGAAAWSGAESLAGLGVLSLVILAYGGFWLAVAVLIGCFARRTTEAAIAAGGVWLLIVVMAPSLTLAAVNLAVPPPSQMRLATDVKARLATTAAQQTLHRRSASTAVRSPPPVIPDHVRDAYAELLATDLDLAPLIESHERAQDARRRVLDKVRLLLPAVAVQDALDRIAGSDADRALAFQHQVHAFWQARRLLHKAYLDRDAPQTLAEYEALPRFRFVETARVGPRGVRADLAALLAATLILLIAAGSLRRRLVTP